jgi:hypothetical protein
MSKFSDKISGVIGSRKVKDKVKVKVKDKVKVGSGSDGATLNDPATEKAFFPSSGPVARFS